MDGENQGPVQPWCHEGTSYRPTHLPAAQGTPGLCPHSPLSLTDGWQLRTSCLGWGAEMAAGGGGKGWEGVEEGSSSACSKAQQAAPGAV